MNEQAVRDSLSPEVKSALVAAFGGAPIDQMAPLGGGASGATLVSLTVGGSSYVLKRPDPARLAHAERTEREIACLEIASKLGVAPKVVYADRRLGISIMAKIDPTGPVLGAPRDPRWIARVVASLRALHQGPAFSALGGPVDAVRAFDRKVRERSPDGLPTFLLGTLDEIERLTRPWQKSAPCHNDLNPGNILITDDAAYFVDWETAAQGDPFFDLGELGVFMFPLPAARDELLAAYVGGTPKEEERARATLARVTALGFYTAAFIMTAGMRDASAPPLDEKLALSIPDLLRAFGEGRASQALVAASLFREMAREAGTDEFAKAKRVLDATTHA